VRVAWVGALKDLRRLKRDPLAVLVWIAIPILLAITLSAVFGSSTTQRAGLLIADEDATPCSRALLAVLEHEPFNSPFRVETLDQPEGRRRMERGEAAALLIVPRGFSRTCLHREPARLKLIANPSEPAVAGIVEEALHAEAEELIGEFPDSTGQQIIVESRQAESAISRVDYAVLFFPGLLVMSVMFVGANLSRDVWTEHREGTLRRFMNTPRGLSLFLSAKLCAATVVLLGVEVGGLAVSRWLLNMRKGSSAVALLGLASSGIALYLFMMLLQVYASDERGGGILNNFVLFPLAMAGGTLFPFELMPSWLAAIGPFTPNGWAVLQLKAALNGSATSEQCAVTFAASGLAAVTAFLLAVRRMRRAFAR
jgi:ABC-2 type transport system permease protein